MLSGENDHDQQTRGIATAQEFGLAPGERIRIIAGSYPIARAIDEIKRDDERFGPDGLIVADTSFAFFGGDNDNSNAASRPRRFIQGTDETAG